MMDINVIYDKLIAYYGEQGWWPLLRGKNDIWVSDYSISNLTKVKKRDEILEICLGAILTQNCSWKNVEKSLNLLKEKNAFSIEYLSSVDEAELIEMIRSCGYYNQKLKKIKFFCKYINGVFEQEYNVSRDGLLSVWGIGPETADDILLYAFDVDTFVIDLYTIRILSRIGFCSPDIAYNELKANIEKSVVVNASTSNNNDTVSKLNVRYIGQVEGNKYLKGKLISDKTVFYKQLHALFVEHAKRYCRKKPLCSECIFNGSCKQIGI